MQRGLGQSRRMPRRPWRESINQNWSTNVRFEAHDGLRRDIAPRPKSATSGCSDAWLPPPKYRNSEAPKKGYSLVAHFHPVPDRRGVSVKNLTRPAQKTVCDPIKNTSTMKEGRDLSLDKARLHLSDAIDAQIDCDDASDDLIKEKLHSTSVHQVLIGRPSRIARRFGRVEGRTQARMSATWFVVWPDLVLVQMRE
jgi:hypothetical protein